jgi:alkylation response protein AidB-like acyl-CoA dehydrogenase
MFNFVFSPPPLSPAAEQLNSEVCDFLKAEIDSRPAVHQCGPTLLRYGTEQQCAEILPRIARGECFFCVGVSEPDSGSDLASVRTRAVEADGGYRINGTKLWTTYGHRSHYMILFCRTDDDKTNRHAGMSQFLVDLSLPGSISGR